MPNSLQFHTGLITTDYYRFPEPPFKGLGWEAILVEGPSESTASEHHGDKIYRGKEIVIVAQKEVKAQRAANLIHAARMVLEGSNTFSHLYPGENVT